MLGGPARVSNFLTPVCGVQLMKRVSAEGGPSRPGRGAAASRFGAGRAAGSPAESQRTSRLETQLRQMRQERVDAEHKLEQEQEFLVNKFQRQMNTLMASKRCVWGVGFRIVWDAHPLTCTPRTAATSSRNWRTSAVV